MIIDRLGEEIKNIGDRFSIIYSDFRLRVFELRRDKSNSTTIRVFTVQHFNTITLEIYTILQPENGYSLEAFNPMDRSRILKLSGEKDIFETDFDDIILMHFGD